MIYKNLKYKETAVKQLFEKANELLEESGSDSIIFKAPTGAGKTIIMADFLMQFISERKDHRTFSFIWAAPRKLHTQSKEKLESFYKDNRILECSNIEELTDKKINENEILFLNWESINKKDNVFIKENENDFNLTSIINNTIEEGREIILVIDESHHTASAENTKGLIEIMKPKITIEVSATPHMTSDNIVKVKFEHVVKEGMIKEKVSLNPELKEDKLEGEGSDEFILKAALKKREELKKLRGKRLQKRLKQGMINEVKKLKKSGISWKRLEEFGLEYRYIALYLQGEMDYGEMTAKLQKEIEHFAKRQMTWFKRNKRIYWVKNHKRADKLIQKFLKIDKIYIK